MNHNAMFVAIALISANAIADSKPSMEQKPSSGYAESIYGDYANTSGGKVGFALRTITSGSTKELAGIPFSALIATPKAILNYENDGYRSWNHVLEPADAGLLADLHGRVEGFAEAGFPVNKGAYRIIEVEMNLGGAVSKHHSIEFCWQEQSHCVILDPSIKFLDSTAKNQMALRAQGLVPLETSEASEATRAGTCGLASNKSIKSKVVNYPARTLTWKNVFGNLLVRKDLGASQHGIRCDTSCKPQPYGYSNPSSGEGRLGWRVACDHAYGQGISGSTAKSTGITGCSDRYAVAASFDASVNGTGANVNINVDSGGAVHNNGGFVYDSCGIF
jgi:hypothetical protein